MTSKMDINWGDDDGAFEEEFKTSKKKSVEETEFASMMETETSEPVQSFYVGDKVEGVICSLSETSNDVTVEIGGKVSAVMSKAELCDEDHNLKFSLGETISAFVVSKKGGEIVLSNSLNHAVAKENALQTAYEARIPVKGRVEKVNKGGFEVSILGKNAFCPVSQIDLKFVTDKDVYLGKEFDFLVEKLDGRNLVVSRSALLKTEQAGTIVDLKKLMDAGTICDGEVEDLRDFGAMVSVMGVTGMVHISEVNHSRVGHVSEVLTTGQSVKVKILSIDEQKGSPRISLSIKQAGEDPWDSIAEKINADDSYTGKVRRLDTFGAFVEIEPGVEGLIHVSEMSWVKRVNHPKELLTVGDVVNVRVLNVDVEKKRISLSMKSIEDDPWVKAKIELVAGTEMKAKVQSLKGFGAIVELREGISGMLPVGTLKAGFGESYRRHATPDKEITVIIVTIDSDERKILLTLPNLDNDEDGVEEYKEYLKAESARLAAKKPDANSSMGSFGALLQSSLKGN